MVTLFNCEELQNFFPQRLYHFTFPNVKWLYHFTWSWPWGSDNPTHSHPYDLRAAAASLGPDRACRGSTLGPPWPGHQGLSAFGWQVWLDKKNGGKPDTRRALWSLKGLSRVTSTSDHGPPQAWGSGVTTISQLDEILPGHSNNGQRPCRPGAFVVSWKKTSGEVSIQWVVFNKRKGKITCHICQ